MKLAKRGSTPKPTIVETRGEFTDTGVRRVKEEYNLLTGRESHFSVEVGFGECPDRGPEEFGLPAPRPLACLECGNELPHIDSDRLALGLQICSRCRSGETELPHNISKRMVDRIMEYEFLDEVSDIDMARLKHIMGTEDVFSKKRLKFPRKVWKELEREVKEFNCDNIRICDRSNKLQRLFFRIAQEDGCGEEYTWEFEYKGKIYLMGFNY